MALRPFLLCFALLSFLGAAFLWFRTPPDENVIFGPNAPTKDLTGTAMTYRTPKGSEDLVRFVTPNGAEFYTDCLAIPMICTSPRGTAHTLTVTAYFMKPTVFWPISAIEHGNVIVTREDSLLAYRLHIEKENVLYRLPLALAAFFLIAAIWFGNRPALD